MRKLEYSTEESIEHLARKRPLGTLSVQPTYLGTLHSPGQFVMTTKVVLDMVQYSLWLRQVP